MRYLICDSSFRKKEEGLKPVNTNQLIFIEDKRSSMEDLMHNKLLRFVGKVYLVLDLKTLIETKYVVKDKYTIEITEKPVEPLSNFMIYYDFNLESSSLDGFTEPQFRTDDINILLEKVEQLKNVPTLKGFTIWSKQEDYIELYQNKDKHSDDKHLIFDGNMFEYRGYLEEVMRIQAREKRKEDRKRALETRKGG